LRRLLTWAWKLIRDGAVDVFKEIRKRIGLALLLLAGGWLLAFISKLYNLETLPSWIDVPALILQALGDLFLWIGGGLKRLIDAALSNYVIFIIGLVLAVGYIILFVLFRRAKGVIEHQGAILREGAIHRELVEQAGLGGKWPHAAKNGTGAPWADLCQEIQRPGNSILYILGANGLETFGETGAPLYDALELFRGTVRVILLDPDSEEMAGRAAAVGAQKAAYRRAILKSQTRLKDLQRRHYSIEGRFYNGQPNWKFIITSRTIWVQYYVPGGPNVNETSVWRFDSTGADCLYKLFCMEFERIWRRCAGNPML
jgi:hypothetical protein